MTRVGKMRIGKSEVELECGHTIEVSTFDSEWALSRARIGADESFRISKSANVDYHRENPCPVCGKTKGQTP